ncbi:MAG: lipid-binding protein [Candidatus Cryptobacteroides sp.]
MTKKIIYGLIAGLALMLASCTKDQPGGTQVEALSGDWYVQVDGAYDDPTLEDYEDVFGKGRFHLLTYNTAADRKGEFIIDDLNEFWEFKIIVPCNLETLSFSCEDAKNMVEGYEDLRVKVIDGKVVPDGTVTPSGAKADYIEFYVIFSDDTTIPTYYDKLKISGWRYTGLTNDD